MDIPRQVQPSLVLSVETEELGIAAGLQDRVVQVYEGLVYMDFARDRMEERHGLMCGIYEPLDPKLLPPLYLAYSLDAGEPTEIFHNNLRARFQQREPAVVEAMVQFAELTFQARQSLMEGDAKRFGCLMDANFDLRQSICRLPSAHVEMVEVARHAGATAQFAGSGGAIVGTYTDEAQFTRVAADLRAIGCHVLRPIVDADVERVA